jgi:hypothetical protein
MTNQQLINRFFCNPKEMKANHLRIEKRDNGFALVNYYTDLVFYDVERDHYTFNATKYSSTTSRIQTMIRQGLPKPYATIIDGCERGFTFKL